MYLTKLKTSRKHKIRLKSFSGRNNQGRITVRHKGGGEKKFFRSINWNISLQSSIIMGVLYNPTTQGMLYKIFNPKTDSTFLYPSNTENFIFDSFNELNSLIKMPLSRFSIGTKCNNLTIKNKIIYSKSPGTNAIVIQRYTWIKNYMLLELPSGEQKLFLNDTQAIKGEVRGNTNFYEKIKKAGRSRWLGRRPTVRGVAMNPIDHPHGGGEGKTSGGRPSVSKWGRLTKNVKTRFNRREQWKIVKKRNS